MSTGDIGAEERQLLRDHDHQRDHADRQPLSGVRQLVLEPDPLRVSVGELPEGVPQGDYPVATGSQRTGPVCQRRRQVHGGHPNHPDQQRHTLRRRADRGRTMRRGGRGGRGDNR